MGPLCRANHRAHYSLRHSGGSGQPRGGGRLDIFGELDGVDNPNQPNRQRQFYGHERNLNHRFYRVRPADLVPVSTGPGPAPDGFVLVAALVGAIRRGRALVIRAENLDDALALVEQAAGLVPPGIGRLLHWSTLVPDAGAPPGPGLAVAVPPWSANTEAATPVDRLTAGESDRLIARQLLAPSQALPGFKNT